MSTESTWKVEVSLFGENVCTHVISTRRKLAAGGHGVAARRCLEPTSRGRAVVLASVALGAALSGAPPALGAWEPSGRLGQLEHEQVAVPLATRVVGPMEPAVRWKLERGEHLAHRRLLRRPACRRLFAALGAEPLQVLAGIHYLPAHDPASRATCRRHGAFAFTSVGSGRTVLCSASFGQLMPRGAARVVLHEALHFAGMPESPAFPDAPSSIEIDHLVQKACGL
jgi:hypothetical protein